MKRLIIFILPAIVMVSCIKQDINNQVTQTQPKFYGNIFQEESRTYVDEQIRMRWHEEDQVSIFAGSTLNRKYQFDGKTGANSGYFTDISNAAFGAGNEMNNHYAVYPYHSANTLTEDGKLYVNYPTEQIYTPNTFGKNANMMVAITANTQDHDLIFRNVASYLRVRLWGENQNVKSISLVSKGDEPLSGKAVITPIYGNSPLCEMVEINKASVTLACTSAVSVNTTEDSPIEFWIVIPPITLSEGFSVAVSNNIGGTQTFDIDKEFTFERNKHYTLTRQLEIPAPDVKLVKEIKILDSSNNGHSWTFTYNNSAKIIKAVDRYYEDNDTHIESTWDISYLANNDLYIDERLVYYDSYPNTISFEVSNPLILEVDENMHIQSWTYYNPMRSGMIETFKYLYEENYLMGTHYSFEWDSETCEMNTIYNWENNINRYTYHDYSISEFHYYWYNDISTSLINMDLYPFIVNEILPLYYTFPSNTYTKNSTILFSMGYLGKTNENYISKIEQTYSESSYIREDRTITLQWIFDENNHPIKSIISCKTTTRTFDRNSNTWSGDETDTTKFVLDIAYVE